MFIPDAATERTPSGPLYKRIIHSIREKIIRTYGDCQLTIYVSTDILFFVYVIDVEFSPVLKLLLGLTLCQFGTVFTAVYGGVW